MQELLELVKEFDKRFTSGNNTDVDTHIKVPRDEWRAIRDKILEEARNKE